MKEIRVQIPHDVCAEVERRFFEYNAAKDIIKFLMSREDVLESKLMWYINNTETRFTELELLKDEVTSQYKPEGMGDVGYEFDFKESCIVYKAN